MLRDLIALTHNDLLEVAVWSINLGPFRPLGLGLRAWGLGLLGLELGIRAKGLGFGAKN